MIVVEYAKTLASYNRQMNARIYDCAARLTDEQRKRDVGAFFKSIHGTLNHLLLGDRVWLGRFTHRPFVVSSLSQELYSDFAELQRQRVTTDADIESWAASLAPNAFEGTLNYTGISDAKPRSLRYALAVTHFFNHQTHHRGQVTALLMQAGIDPGVTDLIAFQVP